MKQTICGMLLLLVLVCSSANAALPGVNGKIAFSSNRDGSFQIYVMNVDGTGQTQLTNDLPDNYGPAWSPDGARIAFGSTRDRNEEIYVMNANGSSPTRLTNNAAHDAFPEWSPDDRQIAFDSDRDGGNPQIYVMSANGSSPTRLTNTGGTDQFPAWSPDGSQIAFMSWRDVHFQIYVMNADGSDQTNLSNNAALDSGPDWQRLPIPIPPTVVIGACDSGVPNYDVVPGTTLNDAIAQCAAMAKNHGKFVECVSALTNGWQTVGLITGAQNGAIMRCAAKAS